MTGKPLPIQINSLHLHLLPEKAVFLPHNETLVIADLHLGKASHFRKAGIIIPPEAGLKKDYSRLQRLMQSYNPKRLLFLGDLFHSEENTSWLHFLPFIQQYPQTAFSLIKGNHDILPSSLYAKAGLRVYETDLQEDPIIYSHAPLSDLQGCSLNIAGHIHPGVLLNGLGRQSLRLPCFHYTAQRLILPAFGSLTGLQLLSKRNARQFVITDKTVWAI